MNESVNVRIPNTNIGLGKIDTLGNEVLKFKANKVLLITDQGIVKAGLLESIKKSIAKENINLEIFEGSHPEPSIPLIESIITKIISGNFDLLIGVGGGSNMDATKVASAFAYGDPNLSAFVESPQGTIVKGRVVSKILIPTTAGTGSEWSSAAVIYDKSEYPRPFGHERFWADKVIIDPQLTINLPQKLTADTGFDALTHAIEAYTSVNGNVISSMLAGTAIKLIRQNLRLAYAKGNTTIEARYNMSVAAAMAMNAAVSSGGGGGGISCHQISGDVQGKARISHGASLAIMLPAVMEYNMNGRLQKTAEIAALLGEDTTGLSLPEAGAKAITAVRKLIGDLGLPRKMSEVGITGADIAPMAKSYYETAVLRKKIRNPQDPSEADITRVYKSAL